MLVPYLQALGFVSEPKILGENIEVKTDSQLALTDTVLTEDLFCQGVPAKHQKKDPPH